FQIRFLERVGRACRCDSLLCLLDLFLDVSLTRREGKHRGQGRSKGRTSDPPNEGAPVQVVAAKQGSYDGTLHSPIDQLFRRRKRAFLVFVALAMNVLFVKTRLLTLTCLSSGVAAVRVRMGLGSEVPMSFVLET